MLSKKTHLSARYSLDTTTESTKSGSTDTHSAHHPPLHSSHSNDAINGRNQLLLQQLRNRRIVFDRPDHKESSIIIARLVLLYHLQKRTNRPHSTLRLLVRRQLQTQVVLRIERNDALVVPIAEIPDHLRATNKLRQSAPRQHLQLLIYIDLPLRLQPFHFPRVFFPPKIALRVELGHGVHHGAVRPEPLLQNHLEDRQNQRVILLLVCRQKRREEPAGIVDAVGGLGGEEGVKRGAVGEVFSLQKALQNRRRGDRVFGGVRLEDGEVARGFVDATTAEQSAEVEADDAPSTTISVVDATPEQVGEGVVLLADERFEHHGNRGGGEKEGMLEGRGGEEGHTWVAEMSCKKELIVA